MLVDREEVWLPSCCRGLDIAAQTNYVCSSSAQLLFALLLYRMIDGVASEMLICQFLIAVIIWDSLHLSGASSWLCTQRLPSRRGV